MQYDLIRTHYEQINDRIIERSLKGQFTDPYCRTVDFAALMTRIEYDAWQVIRGFGKAPLYPQYPVGRFFADFANPLRKIAVECDGREFHKDKQKDSARDKEFNALGWTVFRVTGADCVRQVSLDVDEFDFRERTEVLYNRYDAYYRSTVDGLIRAIGANYFKYPVNEFEESMVAECLQKRATLGSPLKLRPF